MFYSQSDYLWVSNIALSEIFTHQDALEQSVLFWWKWVGWWHLCFCLIPLRILCYLLYGIYMVRCIIVRMLEAILPYHSRLDATNGRRNFALRTSPGLSGELQQKIILRTHLQSCHVRLHKMFHIIMSRYWLPTPTKTIATTIARCMLCQKKWNL